MKNRLTQLLLNLPTNKKYVDGICVGEQLHSAETIADYLLSEGVVVPPVKVGQTVYEIQPIRQRVQSYEITTLKWNGHYWWFTWIIKDHNGIYGNVEGFSSRQIGKTVFLTREEAEKALKKGGAK